MALALDASTPAAVHNATNVTTVTTAAFSPPAGSVIVVLWPANDDPGVSQPGAPSITDSLGSHLVYTQSDWSRAADTANTGNGQVAIWSAPCPSAQTNMTITVTTGNTNPTSGNDGHLRVQVWTGADTSTPIGAHGKSGGASQTGTATYAATRIGSIGELAFADWNASASHPTLQSGNTEDSWTTLSGQETGWVARQTTASTSVGQSVTLGATAPTVEGRYAYVEVLPSATVASVAPAPLVVGPPNTPAPVPKSFISSSQPLGSPAVGTRGPLVVGPPNVPVPIPRNLRSSNFPLGNPAVPTPQPLVVSPPFVAAPIPGVRIFGPGAPAAAVASASTPGPLVVGPPNVPTPVYPAQVFSPAAVATTSGALVVSPPFAPVPVPAVSITSSFPLGNPAVGTPPPLVVSTAWRSTVPGAIITSGPVPPPFIPTPGPLVVSPPYVPVPVPAVSVTASQPLGNPAVSSPQPLVVSAPWSAKVPGALLFGPGAQPPPVSTVGTPGPLVVGPPNVPVPIPKTYLSWSFPLGSPAVGTPEPLVVGPPFAAVPVPGAQISGSPATSVSTPGPLVVGPPGVPATVYRPAISSSTSTTASAAALVVTPTFTLAPVPGARVFAAPAAPVSAVGTPNALVVTPPFIPVAIPKTFFSASFPLGRPAVASPQPLLVTPTHRWTQLTPALLMSGAGCACTVTRPSTGTTGRPATGTTVYATATTARPSTGTTARPSTGTTKDPCC